MSQNSPLLRPPLELDYGLVPPDDMDEFISEVKSAFPKVPAEQHDQLILNLIAGRHHQHDLACIAFTFPSKERVIGGGVLYYGDSF